MAREPREEIKLPARPSRRAAQGLRGAQGEPAVSSRELDHYDINVKPTPRSGWWLMVLLMWDAVFHRTPNYERARSVMTEGD
jgi:hypothetical protein